MTRRTTQLPRAAVLGAGTAMALVLAVTLVGRSGPTPAAVRTLARSFGAAPIRDAAPQPPALVTLGRSLFFDPLLSGNRDVSCATCHAPARATGDGRSLSVGTAARAISGKRMPRHEHGVTPRNAPALFNLDQDATRALFWDGRLERQDDGSVVLFELGAQRTNLPRIQFDRSLDTLAAAQAMFPVLARNEMRGHPSDSAALGKENELAAITDGDFEAVWRAEVRRLLAVPRYRELFAAAYPDVPAEHIAFSHAARALGAFEVSAFTLTGAPWDRFLAGDDGALTRRAREGAHLFYGRAGCARCHSGPRLTDDKLHNIGVPAMTRGPSSKVFVDYGAAHRSNGGDEARFGFHTPPLRNVAKTGPYMHDGCYATLRSAVLHHLDPSAALLAYDDAQLAPEFRQQLHRTARVKAEVQETLDPLVATPLRLTSDEVDALVAFLEALTSPAVDRLSEHVPSDVPSGLALVDP
jgi:cytochrome c peroxidase